MSNQLPKPLNPVLMTSEELEYLSKNTHYNNVIIDVEELRRRIHLNLPPRWRAAISPCAGLGTIDKLPVEVQFKLFAVTPINPLINLRATNSQAKHLIEQSKPFRMVMTYGADIVRALLATKAGFYWTAEQIVGVLFSTTCEFCSERGEILQILHLKRCCFRCLS